ncbi:Acyl-CoA synthetase member 3, mitochondrial [Datura stramonium]|uniref:Acyl-CoA synthetase member 3, mitochondrial n=1 Tax=Datura stramonium TaxID=4076 RepID=A0ABS8RY20_DATST|nr:Acyl-CoA synthetase member 3, mitochondrial [Datura stramonium]
MDNLPKCGANYVPLTPLTFLTRASRCYANRTSIIYGNVRFTWGQTYERCCRLASSLQSLNIVKNDVVSVLAPNVPAIYEMHFAVPMAGAVLNPINTRLDAKNIALILKHSEAKLFFPDAVPSTLGSMKPRPSPKSHGPAPCLERTVQYTTGPNPTNWTDRMFHHLKAPTQVTSSCY